MPAKIIPCLLPYVNLFERDVTEAVKDRLDDKFYLLHNFELPSPKRGLNTKEIDLCIVSKFGEIILIEIKAYEKPPTLTQAHLITYGGRTEANPIKSMKLYGQRLKQTIKDTHNLSFGTYSWLVTQKLDPERIEHAFRDSTFDLDLLLDHLERNSKTRGSKYNKDQIETIIRTHLCSGGGSGDPPSEGFTGDDFDLLKRSRDYEDSERDKEYYYDVKRQIHRKFRWLSWDILEDLGKHEIVLYPHIQKEIHLGTGPISFMCFTMNNVEDYLSDPQFSFHISATDWYENYKAPRDNFAVKLSLFGKNKWLRSFLKRYKERPDEVLGEIKGRLGKNHYWFTSGITTDIPFIVKPVADLQRDDIDRLYERIIVNREGIRGVGFEKPLYWDESRHKKLFANRKQTVSFLCKEFRDLISFARAILPFYFN